MGPLSLLYCIGDPILLYLEQLCEDTQGEVNIANRLWHSINMSLEGSVGITRGFYLPFSFFGKDLSKRSLEKKRENQGYYVFKYKLKIDGKLQILFRFFFFSFKTK